MENNAYLNGNCTSKIKFHLHSKSLFILAVLSGKESMDCKSRILREREKEKKREREFPLHPAVWRHLYPLIHSPLGHETFMKGSWWQ